MLGEQLEATLKSLQSTVGDEIGLPQSNDSASQEQFIASEKRTVSDRRVENLKVAIRPSNCSQRRLELIDGYCKNISKTGCGVVSDFAPRVGDIYQFSVPTQLEHPLNGANARCVRCHLLDEEAFECGFSFMAPLKNEQTPSQSQTQADDLLV